MLKRLISLFLLLVGVLHLPAQQALTDTDALSQLYHDYVATNGTARWSCTSEQASTGMHQGWPCTSDNALVQVSVLLKAEVREDATRTYLVASSIPTKGALGEFNCHACQPAIGVAVFVKQGSQWILENSNAAVGFFGGWGESPGIELVNVGPGKHGIILSDEDMAQGFASSSKHLLLPLGKTVVQAWSIQDENDNFAAIDPEDKLNKQAPYRASATFRFFSTQESNGEEEEYYRIEVVSRGADRKDSGHPIRSESWTRVYEFRDGKYRLVQHQTKKSRSKKGPQ